MSRTFRNHLDGEYIIKGNIIPWKDFHKNRELYQEFSNQGGLCYRYRIIKSRDFKPWNKPPKKFKQINRRRERSQIQTAIKSNREIPFFKKTDEWEWS